MMKNLRIYILLVINLAIALNFEFMALAWGNSDYEINRPQIKYKSGNLRDPFASVVIKEEVKEVLANNDEFELNEPKIDLDAIDIQGIVWGGKMSQAIINNKVMVVGDLIQEAEILSIDKKGIVINFNGEIINLSAPG